MRLRTGSNGSPCALLKGDDEFLAEEDGDLLVAVRGDIVDHREDDKGMVLEEIDLGALPGVDHVFQRQRMQLEDAADLRDQLDIGEPDAVEPEHRPLVAIGATSAMLALSMVLHFSGEISVRPKFAAARRRDRRSACRAMRRPASAAFRTFARFMRRPLSAMRHSGRQPSAEVRAFVSRNSQGNRCRIRNCSAGKNPLRLEHALLRWRRWRPACRAPWRRLPRPRPAHRGRG